MSKSSEMKTRNDIVSKVSEWLGQEGMTFTLKPNPYADFDLLVEYPNKSNVNVLFEKNKKDSMLFATNIKFDDEQKKAFAYLKPHLKSEFLIATSSYLCSMNLIHSAQPNQDKMEYLHIEKRLFFDGLTKETFFDTLNRVLNGIGLAVLTYTKYLSKDKGINSTNLSSIFFF